MICKVGFPDKSPHIEGRAIFHRAAPCARATLNTDIELIFLDKGFRVDLHKVIFPQP